MNSLTYRCPWESIPYFAPFRFGPYEMHGEQVGNDGVMVWVYDLREFETDPPACGMSATVAIELGDAPTRNQREKLAWGLRNIIHNTLSIKLASDRFSSLPTEGEAR